MYKSYKKIYISIISILTVVLIWEAMAFFHLIDIDFFPPPHTFFLRALTLNVDGFYANDLFPSFTRLFIATLITLPISLFFGVLAGAKPTYDQILNPLFSLSYPLPKVAMFPLLLMIFGIGSSSQVALISIGMFHLLYINIRNGTLKIYQSTIMDITKIYKIKGFNFYYYILLKGILRDLLIGMKSALGYGLTLVVVSEFSISKNGIGHFVWRSWDQFKIVDMYAGILVLSITGFLLTSTLDYFIEINNKQ